MVGVLVDVHRLPAWRKMAMPAAVVRSLRQGGDRIVVDLRRVRLPGQVWGLAATDAGGPVFVTANGDDLSTTVLSAVDLSGRVLWRREFDGHPGPPRIGDDGTVWVAHRGPEGAVLSGLDAAGEVRYRVRPEHEPHERVGAFAVLPDGVRVGWLPAERMRIVRPGRHARVPRHGADGACRWSAPAVLGEVAHPGIVEVGQGRPMRPKRPWSPQTIQAHAWEPLLVSGERIAATFADGGSGIAVTFFLDTGTGRPVATTPPGPGHHNAIAGPVAGRRAVALRRRRPPREPGGVRTPGLTERVSTAAVRDHHARVPVCGPR